jgi:CTP:molybdopterin cytidylyltransferase MocA
VHHVAVRILHPPTREDAGELTRLVGTARSIAAEDLARRFETAGAEGVVIVSDDDDGQTFGGRLRAVIAGLEPGSGLVVLGSGSIPLATDTDLRALVDVARSGDARALTNNRYSSDVVAIGRAAILAAVPDLPADNVLPRWLTSVAGVPVDELPDRRRLAMDVDSPLDLELVRRDPACPRPLAELAKSMAHRLSHAAEAFDALGALARDPAKELFVAGRLSAATLRDLEERTACRIRALVEERGLRASAALAGTSEAGDADDEDDDERGGGARQRPPASLLGLLLDRDGPASIGALVHGLADGAAIDTRVLLAHRHGADEAAWPSPEDRYASDLLLADRVRDPWLQQLTLHAWSHAIPIALGGHSLVGPGLRLALGLDR